MNIQNILTQEQKNKIEQKIIEIEKATSAEVVPMVVGSSTPTGHVRVILFLAFILLADFVMQAFLSVDSWSQSKYWEWAAAIIASGALSFWLAKNHFIQRVLTSNQDEILQVNRRALLEFYDQSLHEKHNEKMVLFLFSLMERRIVILTSPELKSTFSDSDLKEIIQEFSVQNKKQDFSQGLIAALEKTGSVLKQKLPVAKDEIKKDEACNKIIIKN